MKRFKPDLNIKLYKRRELGTPFCTVGLMVSEAYWPTLLSLAWSWQTRALHSYCSCLSPAPALALVPLFYSVLSFCFFPTVFLRSFSLPQAVCFKYVWAQFSLYDPKNPKSRRLSCLSSKGI